jgi:tetratricopeptide (TPR) repeat protein
MRVRTPTAELVQQRRPGRIADFTKAIEINPHDADNYNNRGIAYRANIQIDRAIEDYSKAIEINPRDANAYYNRGAAYRAKNNIDLAIADYSSNRHQSAVRRRLL